jgi:hypothetical protein
LTGRVLSLKLLKVFITISFREFDCMKFGSDGVALVSQEDGGGAHPGYPPVISAGTDAEIDSGGPDTIEDYDENVG